MGTRKSMTLPIIITFLVIAIIVFLFTNIKQSQIVCEMNTTFEGDIRLYEKITTLIDGKRIHEMMIVKTILLPPKYTTDDTYFQRIQSSLDKTLEYLEDNVKYQIGEDRITTKIHVKKNETILLKNIQLQGGNNFDIKIDSNTKSSDVVTLKVGDNYTDGELMQRLKKNGYNCK